MTTPVFLELDVEDIELLLHAVNIARAEPWLSPDPRPLDVLAHYLRLRIAQARMPDESERHPEPQPALQEGALDGLQALFADLVSVPATHGEDSPEQEEAWREYVKRQIDKERGLLTMAVDGFGEELDEKVKVYLSQDELDAWIADLRSGEFKQTTGALKGTEDGVDAYCCLGVYLCRKVEDREDVGNFYKNASYERLDLDLGLPLVAACECRNDVSGWSFEEIANWLEEWVDAG